MAKSWIKEKLHRMRSSSRDPLSEIQLEKVSKPTILTCQSCSGSLNLNFGFLVWLRRSFPNVSISFLLLLQAKPQF